MLYQEECGIIRYLSKKKNWPIFQRFLNSNLSDLDNTQSVVVKTKPHQKESHTPLHKLVHNNWKNQQFKFYSEFHFKNRSNAISDKLNCIYITFSWAVNNAYITFRYQILITVAELLSYLYVLNYKTYKNVFNHIIASRSILYYIQWKVRHKWKRYLCRNPSWSGWLISEYIAIIYLFCKEEVGRR